MIRRMRFRPPTVQSTIVQLPNGFTLANLFFGIFAIVAASRGNFDQAVWCVVFGGIADALDGRVARAVGASGPFGEELDSLVDAITFGLAPAMIVYFSILRHEGWDWIFCFFFTACAVIRLARFNVMQAGSNKTHFIGLPSPAAGGTLATYFWFSETDLYRETVIGDLPWQFVLRALMLLLAFLMISNVPYPAWPRFTLHTWRGRIGIITLLAMMVGLIFLPKQFIFPLAIGYLAYGIIAAVVVGLTAETPDEDFLGEEDVGEEYAIDPRFEGDDDDVEFEPVVAAPRRTPRSAPRQAPRPTPRPTPALRPTPRGVSAIPPAVSDGDGDDAASVARKRRKRRKRGPRPEGPPGGGPPGGGPPAIDVPQEPSE